MNWLHRVMAHFGLVGRLPTQRDDLERTKAKHEESIRKADRFLRDYAKADDILIRVERRPR